MSDANQTIDNRSVELFADTFGRLFSTPFTGLITDVARRRRVIRHVDAVSDAAAQGLARFLNLEQPTADDLDALFVALRHTLASLNPFDLWPPIGSAEARAVELGASFRPTSWPTTTAARFGISLELVVSALWQAGAVLHAWEQVQFSEQYEPAQTLLGQLKELGNRPALPSGPPSAVADEHFDAKYRDYLLQRWGRIDVGTLRAVSTLTTVGLGDLFVMPRVAQEGGEVRDADDAIFNTAAQRTVLIGSPGSGKSTLLLWVQQQVASCERECVLGGEQAVPLLIRVREFTTLAAGSPPRGQQLVELATGSQDIAALMPDGWIDRQFNAGRVLLLLDGLDETDPSVRDGVLSPWLDAIREDYPGCRVVTTSRPAGFVDLGGEEIAEIAYEVYEQLRARSSDAERIAALTRIATQEVKELAEEVALTIRSAAEESDTIPKEFQQAMVSYLAQIPAGVRESLEPERPIVYTLQEFDKGAVLAYLQKWFTQIRIAKNEPAAEAARRGEVDAANLGATLASYPAVAQLARTPLLLSAICLVYYFEGGRLPDDRAVLYRLCVEGLLDRWDAQKGLQSPFTAEEKLRVCRELATAMMAKKATTCSVRIAKLGAQDVLGTAELGSAIIDHMRDRAGLLVERQPGILSFAHLTFQEYLTALAVREENLQGVTIETLAERHTDSRWREVILLYCRIAPPALVRELIQAIRNNPPTESVPPGEKHGEKKLPYRPHVEVLLATLCACPVSVLADPDFKAAMLAYVLSIPVATPSDFFATDEHVRELLADCPFSAEEVTETIKSGRVARFDRGNYPLAVNLAGWWLFTHYNDWASHLGGFVGWRTQNPSDLRQEVWKYYFCSSKEKLETHANAQDLLRAPLSDDPEYLGRLQAEVALLGLSCRASRFCEQQYRFSYPLDVFRYVPEGLLLELLESFNESNWQKASSFSFMFYHFGACISKPSTAALAHRFTNACLAIATRLETMNGASALRAWVQSFSPNGHTS